MSEVVWPSRADLSSWSDAEIILLRLALEAGTKFAAQQEDAGLAELMTEAILRAVNRECQRREISPTSVVRLLMAHAADALEIRRI